MQQFDITTSPPRRFDLRGWRTKRLGQLKCTPEYQELPPILQQLVDFMVRRHEHPDDGMFPSQEKLAERFGVTRQTMNAYLAKIVKDGIFIREHRGRRGFGTAGGRTTNRYRVNPVLLSSVATAPDITSDSSPDSGSSTHVEHVEASLREARGSSANAEHETVKIESPHLRGSESLATAARPPYEERELRVLRELNEWGRQGPPPW